MDDFKDPLPVIFRYRKTSMSMTDKLEIFFFSTGDL